MITIPEYKVNFFFSALPPLPVGSPRFAPPTPWTRNGRTVSSPTGIAGFRPCRDTTIPRRMSRLFSLVQDRHVSSSTGGKALKLLFEHETDPAGIISRGGLRQVSDTSRLQRVVEKALSEQPQAVADFPEEARSSNRSSRFNRRFSPRSISPLPSRRLFDTAPAPSSLTERKAL